MPQAIFSLRVCFRRGMAWAKRHVLCKQTLTFARTHTHTLRRTPLMPNSSCFRKAEEKKQQQQQPRSRFENQQHIMPSRSLAWAQKRLVYMHEYFMGEKFIYVAPILFMNFQFARALRCRTIRTFFVCALTITDVRNAEHHFFASPGARLAHCCCWVGKS